MTNQRTNSCTLCFIIPLILGLLGLSVLYWITKESKAEFIENDLNIKSSNLLSDRQVGGVIVNMHGRDAVLTGMVESEQRSQEIEDIIASLVGVHIVDNQLEIASTPVIEPEPIVEAIPEPQPQLEPEPEPEPEPKIVLAPEPEVEVVEVVEELLQTLDLSGITFLFANEEITEQGTNILNDVVQILAQHQEFNVVIQGHTDSVGNDKLNLDLSQRRAQSVMNHLVSQGIQVGRMIAIGYGEAEPIASNDSPEGRATNRRIEFAVTRRL